MELWRIYVNELFKDDSREDNITINGLAEETFLKITKSEITHAIKMSKTKKAMGCDEIPAEVIKLIDDKGMHVLEEVFNYIYKTGEYPKSWVKSTFVALPKKQTLNNARTTDL